MIGVSETALVHALDEVCPQPAIDVLAAIIVAFGVDPAWLLYGVYDSAAHRRVADAGLRNARDVLGQLVAASA